MRRILNYNENKVQAGTAVCLHENLFGRDAAKLSFYDKLEGLENFSNRNMRATSKAVHISLNFHPQDKVDELNLPSIADAYLEKIGFANQPYLVYRHFDAGHPHIHIVTTNIQRDGKRIVMYNIGRNQSEQARQQIEKDFRLTVATGRRYDVKVDVVQAAGYGKAETKRAIASAVQRALKFRYTSLAEFNAVLKQFNVIADPGKEGSAMNLKRGLQYAMLDRNGLKAGVPIKASSIYGKPMLKYLEKQFRLNEVLKEPHRNALKLRIDEVLKTDHTRYSFIKALNKDKIYVLFRKSKQGQVYGVTFVDNVNKVVFNGSDLGKNYSAKAILEKLRTEPYEKQIDQSVSSSFDAGLSTMMDELITSREQSSGLSPTRLVRKRKKKKQNP